ncbi:MAG: FAD-dependent monooxygenase [Burkholderiales bacterium]|nr:FAD-dependent monooxygenase [Burkholderiales bacterium]
MKQRIAVAGAGPAGLVAALALARAGHAVHVFERRDCASTASRATTFHPPAVDLLDTLGVLDALAPQGRAVEELKYFRCYTGRPELAAHFRLELLKDQVAHPWRLHLEQYLLTDALRHAVAALPSARVEFGAAVVDLAETGTGIDVCLERESGPGRESFDWLIGADGVRSTVRGRAGLRFEGEDYAKRVLRVMTPADLPTLIPGLAGVSYLYYEDDSASLLQMRDHWRIVLRLPETVTDEEALDPAYLHKALRRFVRTAPDLPAQARDTYSASRRIASAFRRGRVLLIGDAAHVTNTRGGMNMNAGMFDAWTLAQEFSGAADAAALEVALDTWADRRRAIAVDELVTRTERSVGGGATYLAAIEASARFPDRARRFLREVTMLDIAPDFAAPPAAAS